MDGDSSLGFAEFVVFIVVVKNIEKKALDDAEFAERAFPMAFSGEGRRFTLKSSAEVIKEEVDGVVASLPLTFEGIKEVAIVPGSQPPLQSILKNDSSGGNRASSGKKNGNVQNEEQKSDNNQIKNVKSAEGKWLTSEEEKLYGEDLRRTLEAVIVASIDTERIADRIVHEQRSQALDVIETAVQEAMKAFVAETSKQMADASSAGRQPLSGVAVGEQVTPGRRDPRRSELNRGNSAKAGSASKRGVLFLG